MKKLMFSAILLIAFSTFSFANNEINDGKEIKVSKLIVEDSPECLAAGRAAYIYVVNSTGSHDKAKEARIAVTKACTQEQQKPKLTAE